MPGVFAHPQPRVVMKKPHELVTTGTSNIPTFPAQWFTAYFVLFPVTGLFCHRRLQVTTCKLDASVGAPGPHDFAVRERHHSSIDPALVHRIPRHVL
jgi:hypothetical protein